MALAGWWLHGELTTERIVTAYGETRTVSLPDGSLVTLNAHSELRYRRQWDEAHPREVWLGGEAFFEVARKTVIHKPAKFVVHASQLDVVVIGTKFNVRDRRGKTQVVLNEGKVTLQVPTRDDLPALEMKPGELAEFRQSASRIQKQAVNQAHYASWKDKKLVFYKTKLSTVAQILEDTYGMEVIITDPELAAQELTGEIATDNLDVLLQAMTRTFDIRLKKEDNRLLLDKIDP